MAIHDAAAIGFAAAADAYERGRPAYPAAAIELLAHELDLRQGRRVLDLAAGTGKLTRLLAPTGADIVAVEPVREMRAHLARAVPSAEVLDGVAETMPLPNGSVDAVVIGQAFHWFDGVPALSEIHRVMRRGGRLGLIWQVRDVSLPWLARFDELINRLDTGNPRHETGAWRRTFELSALFGPLREATFRHVQVGGVEMVLDRVASISYVAAAGAADRNSLLDDVRRLLETDPATKSAAAGTGSIELPYDTRVFVSEPRGIPVSPTSGFVASVNTSPGGVPKRPVERTMIRRLGLDGDGHTEPEPMHGGPSQAVSVYSIEAIERVAGDGHRAFPGAYGENLTLAGIEFGGLRAGDRLRVGDGAILELTKMAGPCQTIAHWFVERRIARISPKIRPEDSRWYASVLDEGPVAPGDRVELIGTA